MIPYFVYCTQYASSCLGALVEHETDNTTLPVLCHTWHGIILEVYSYPHVELCRGDYYPLMWILWQEHAQPGPAKHYPLCCAWTRMWFHAFPLCLLIGFVAHDLHTSVVVVCRLFVPHCDVDAYSVHAGHTSVMVARSSSSP